ncbi:rRNA maturation RNase YbeY [Akkermansiaceae bacterium]|nr:rRNA maturation RNase YbeY [Akkermansiaceae bacterium]
MKGDPLIEVFAERSPRDFDLETIERWLGGWQKVASLLKGIGVGPIASMDEVEISLLDDSAMSQVHQEFLSDSTSTDVITFEHGEVLIGVEVAERQAVEFEQDFFFEIALYGIHGLLHLSGFDDRVPSDFELMKARQEELLDSYFLSGR